MKKLRNLFLAVLVLIVSFFTVNVAAEEAEDGTITIANAEAGRTYELYRMFDLTSSGSNVAYTVDEDWEDFFFGENAKGSKFIAENNDANKALNPIAYKGETYRMNITNDNVVELATLALEYASDLPANKVDYTDSLPEDSESTTLTFKVDLGYYLVYPQGATEKNEFSNGSIAALTNMITKITINVKAGYPTLEKDVNTFTFDVGQLANFTITGRVPDMVGFESYTYTIHDAWTAGLAYDESKFNLVVKVGNTTLEANQYGLDVDATARKFDLDLTDYVFNNGIVGDAITVTYSFVVTEDAIMSSNTYNEAYLEYSNNPKTDETGTTVPSKEYVYSSRIIIDKFDGKTEEKLAGAEFVLKNSKGEYYYFDTTTKEVRWVSEIKGATVKVTNDNGAATFEGLKDGQYFLVETKAPEGFNLLTEEVEVNIDGRDAEDKTHKVPSTVEAITSAIANYSGAQLPSTGGFGTKLFVIIGSLLAMISGVVLVTNKRMAKEEM